jgi:putative spermidine/putrescine transport system permease protein
VALVHAAKGGALANYTHFFTTDNLWPTIWTTLKLALPATLINVGLALPIAFKMRVKTPYQRFVTTILVVPITLGTVLIAEGMLIYFGPKGWLAQFLQYFHFYDGAIRLTHNFTGVLISLVVSGFPFAFPADPVVHHRHRSRAREGGRHARGRFQGAIPAHLSAASRAGARDVLLPCVRAGVLGVSVRRAAGIARGPDPRHLDRRVRSGVRAYDYSLASAIAMIMGGVQLIIVVAVLGLRNCSIAARGRR